MTALASRPPPQEQRRGRPRWAGRAGAEDTVSKGLLNHVAGKRIVAGSERAPGGPLCSSSRFWEEGENPLESGQGKGYGGEVVMRSLGKRHDVFALRAHGRLAALCYSSSPKEECSIEKPQGCCSAPLWHCRRTMF